MSGPDQENEVKNPGAERKRKNAELMRGQAVDVLNGITAHPAAAPSPEQHAPALPSVAPNAAISQASEADVADDDENAAEGDSGALERPWKDKNPRVIEYFQLRLPEPLHAKLLFVAAMTPRSAAKGSRTPSAHSIALDALEKELDKRLRKMGYKP